MSELGNFSGSPPSTVHSNSFPSGLDVGGCDTKFESLISKIAKNAVLVFGRRRSVPSGRKAEGRGASGGTPLVRVSKTTAFNRLRSRSD